VYPCVRGRAVTSSLCPWGSPPHLPVGYQWDTLRQPVGYQWDTLRQPVGYQWDTLRQPVGYQWDTLRQPAGYQWDTLRQPVGYQWDTLRQPAGRLPDACRTPAGSLPEACRTPAGRLPGACRWQSHVKSGSAPRSRAPTLTLPGPRSARRARGQVPPAKVGPARPGSRCHGTVWACVPAAGFGRKYHIQHRGKWIVFVKIPAPAPELPHRYPTGRPHSTWFDYV